MKLEEIIKKVFTLKHFIILLGVISVIMLILYFSKFNGTLSDDYEIWGAFGDYFGSITGLLAFIIVFYTAVEARKEAKEAKENERLANENADKKEKRARYEATKREERDLFFKLLELHREKFNNVTYTDNNDEHTGLNAFQFYGNILNNLSLDYIIYESIKHIDINVYDNIVRNKFNKYESYLYNLINELYNDLFKIKNSKLIRTQNNTIDLKELQSKLANNELDSLINFELINTTLYFDYKNLFEYLNYHPDFNSLYKGIRYSGNILNVAFGHLIGQYIRNLYYVLETIDGFIDEYDKKQYFKLFRAQLSRTEITVCFYLSLSDKSSSKFVRILKENEMFDDLVDEDLFYTFCDGKYQHTPLEFQNNLFEIFLAEKMSKQIDELNKMSDI